MNIYKIDSHKSKINWSTQSGDLKIIGDIAVEDGTLISELNELIEGHVSINLNSLSVLGSSLSQHEEENLKKHLKSSDLFASDTPMAQFKIKDIVPGEDDHTIKGFLKFNNMAFGLAVQTKLQYDNDELHALGNIQASKSNMVLLEELEKMFADHIKGNKSIKTFKVDCDLWAYVSS